MAKLRNKTGVKRQVVQALWKRMFEWSQWADAGWCQNL